MVIILCNKHLFELSTSKYSGMLSNFNREIANKGLASRELKDFYVEIFDKRQEWDYKVYKFVNEEVKEWLDKAEKLYKSNWNFNI